MSGVFPALVGPLTLVDLLLLLALLVIVPLGLRLVPFAGPRSRQVLKIARKLLNEGGMAIIQIRFMRDSWTSRPKRFAYKRNVISNAYRVETFWDEAEKCGFSPQAVRLVPRETLNDQSNYAYFVLTT